MENIIESDNNIVEDMIYEIRGMQVMLSHDVAKLYQVETKVLNQTIKRNINRFPGKFCFRLTNEEIDILSSRSQIVTLNKSNNLRGYNIKYLPYALTEQGIMMLSGLLKSDIAVKANIQIIDAFVKMRRYFSNSVINNNEILINHENRLLTLENTLDRFKEKEIMIIDNYAGKTLLDILKNIDKIIIIVSKNIDDKLIEKYESQYSNITFINNASFHDAKYLVKILEILNL